MRTAIFFDMDGTLFNTVSILNIALENTFDQLRKAELWQGETPIQQYYDIMGAPLPTVWQKLCPTFDESSRMKINNTFHVYLIEAIQQQRGKLYTGVHDMLETLHKQYPLFVTSNGEVAYLQAIVHTFELNKYFTEVYSIEQIDSLNKSELVAKAIREHSISNGYVVGDRLSDFQAAKDNGLLSIGVAFDFAQKQELQQADYVVQSLKDIPTIVLRKDDL